MSTNPPDRLDRIEAVLEATARRAEQNSESITRLEAVLDRTLQFTDQLREQTEQNTQLLRQTMLTVDRVANAQLELARAFDEDREANRQSLASINAALERIDRILDYLLRQGDRPAES